ncbi:hypothetical protein LMG26858_00354 [Achromobacter anxifer]|uniref:DUF2971 domain-containing protein n=1 Tax=Achromobacter anxifer TaxID=1287737 RepID=A0A6S7DGY0_9BURK|nr:DUF2971 domain-containing protein [Achromobacter anxifer]CAB3824290.1 hypothetical protein LMG26858_00354 [Achromobacter anxifer]
MPIPSLLLHHYTSGQGLLGILDSNSIWSTRIQYLNDSKEFSHAIELARAAIHKRKTDRAEGRFSALCEALTDQLERLSGLAIYVACFSEVEDSLSQWRGYCPPGFGYSIGFDGEQLRNIASAQGFQLRKCIYNDYEQRQAINQWVERTLSGASGSCPPSQEPGAFLEKTAGSFLQEFIEFAPYMKHNAFSAEREWRLVALISFDNARVKLRPGKSMLIPYVPVNLELSLESKLIWNIRIGPTPHIELAMNSASLLFNRIRPVNGIGRSFVPYRDW